MNNTTKALRTAVSQGNIRCEQQTQRDNLSQLHPLGAVTLFAKPGHSAESKERVKVHMKRAESQMEWEVKRIKYRLVQQSQRCVHEYLICQKAFSVEHTQHTRLNGTTWQALDPSGAAISPKGAGEKSKFAKWAEQYCQLAAD